MLETAVVRTVAGAVKRTTELLAQAGCGTPRLDAELLVAEALGVGRERLILEPRRELGEQERAALGAMTARRCDREPIAYILGRQAFRHLTLAVDRRVLIPRPETELLVELGLTLDRGARVVDVGTGSGALALALKHERPDLEVWATDLSEDALDVARANARSLGLEVQFVHGDLLAGVPPGLEVVLSNLPYVALDYPLEPEIANFEPPSAVFGGSDGLAVIRRLVSQAASAPLVGLEVGFDLATSVAELLRAAGFPSVEIVRDLAGHERVVVGRR